MPRDLLADKKTLDGMPELSREPETVASPESVEQQSSLVPHRSSNIAQEGRLKQMGVRPYASLLNIDDLDDCDWLEHAAFDPVEAASREKVRTITFIDVISKIMVNACIFCSVSPLGSARHEPCALLHDDVTQTIKCGHCLLPCFLSIVSRNTNIALTSFIGFS